MRGRRAVVGLLALLVAVGLTFALSALAAPITIVDDGGPDDEVGQKDLNQLTVDSTASPLAVSWNWDDTAWPGGNTGDACALFDTDGDGLANNVVCVGVGGDPATQQYINLWNCSDNSASRCTSPRVGPYMPTGTTFTSSVVSNSDPFRDDPAHTASDCKAASSPPGTNCVTDDTVASGTIVLSDFTTNPTTAKLLNVCSYPSASPTSSPEECVVTPDSGFLTIVKVADPNDGTAFPFNASAASTNGDSSWTINGSGSVQSIPYLATTTLDLNEVVPATWNLSSASCAIQDAPHRPQRVRPLLRGSTTSPLSRASRPSARSVTR